MRYRTRNRLLALLVLVVLVAVPVTVGALTGFLLVGSLAAGVPVLLALSWVTYKAWSWRRTVVAGPGGPGRPPPPPDAGVREPRRPKPIAPAGAVALPLPEDGP